MKYLLKSIDYGIRSRYSILFEHFEIEEIKIDEADQYDDWDSELYITLNSIEDVDKLVGLIEKSIIFNGSDITIYDGYME